MYYAHSANSAGKPEPLEEHLRKTAFLAELSASAFGEGNAGKLMGWHHDLGKAAVFRTSGEMLCPAALCLLPA